MQPGVPILRLAIILALVAYQSLAVSSSFGRFAATPVWIAPRLLIPALFALGGLLGMQSIERRGVAGFLRSRAARIGPRLVVAVTIPALVIGPLVALRTPARYFADPLLWRYFRNLLFWPQFTLPGTFTLNNIPFIVNDIFWTLPVTMAAILLLCATGGKIRRALVLLGASLVLLGAAAVVIDVLLLRPPALVGRALAAMVAFVLGALGQAARRHVPLSPVGAAIAGLAVAAALFVPRNWTSFVAFDVAVAVPVAYFVRVLASWPLPWWAPILVAQRYLGGVLLLSYPVQQASIALVSTDQGFAANLAISLPITVLVAALFWHLVDRRVAALAGLDDSFDAGIAAHGLAPRMSLARRRQRFVARLPELGLWLLFFVVALMVTALTIFAFQPDRAGI